MYLDIAGRSALVVGGGPIGTRRAKTLLAAGADVHVIAPDGTEELLALAEARKLTWHEREFMPDDLERMWLVITATANDEIDRRVAVLCEGRGVWCVNSGVSQQGTARMPAVATGLDGVAVAVSGGRDPGRAKAIRDAVHQGLNDGSLPTRPHRAAGPDGGQVTLVGGGPGDPGLITVSGLQAILAADVLVTDRLAPQALWADPAVGVEVVDVGKAPGKHAASQEQINEIIVDRAKRGLRVVRIKGGDSFVLGRGGEEAMACREAGVPVTIIPGITSAISVPAAAGIPVTQRGITSSFIIASAHEGPEGVIAASAAAPVESTLILLMGAGRLAEIAGGLVEAGRAPQTPLAIVESGWTPQQKTTVSTLGAAAAGEVKVHPPAVVVVGEVVTMRAALGDLAAPSPLARHA